MADLIYENEDGEFEAIYVDATLQEIHVSSVEITEHPIAQGANVTDHVKENAHRLQLQVFISNTPIRSPNVDGASGDIQGVTLDVGSRSLDRGAIAREGADPSEATYSEQSLNVSANVLKFDSEFDRVAAVWDKLDQLKTAGTRFSVVLGLKTYSDMLIREISTPITVQSRGGATFTLEMSEIFTVTTETVDFPEPFDPRAQRNRPQGAQTAEEQEPDSIPTSAAAQLAIDAGYNIQPSRLQGN